jgi:hypothetical protein
MMTCCTVPALAVEPRRGARQRARGVPDLRRPPGDLLPLARTGVALELEMAEAQRAPATADTQPASQLTEQAVLAFALGHPGLGPRRISTTFVQERGGPHRHQLNCVWRSLRRRGLNRRIGCRGRKGPAARSLAVPSKSTGCARSGDNHPDTPGGPPCPVWSFVGERERHRPRTRLAAVARRSRSRPR